MAPALARVLPLAALLVAVSAVAAAAAGAREGVGAEPAGCPGAATALPITNDEPTHVASVTNGELFTVGPDSVLLASVKGSPAERGQAVRPPPPSDVTPRHAPRSQGVTWDSDAVTAWLPCC